MTLSAQPAQRHAQAPDHHSAPTGTRTGQAAGSRRAVAAATRGYLRGDPLDMKSLAAELGVGRATLYRWVGGREELLSVVLADATARTFAAAAERSAGEGADLVTNTCGAFMQRVLEAEPLKRLTTREPLLFLRLATAPGAIEQAAADCVQAMLEREVDAGRMTIALPSDVLAEAIVRICDSHVYARLLGRGEPRVETAVLLIKLLLRH